MKKKNLFSVLFLIAFFLLQFYPALSFAETKRVKVVVENASIRAKANMQSEVVHKPSVGDVFDLEGKEGEWYRVKFQSAAGVFITGYIHEMFVEPTEIAREVPTKKTLPPSKTQPSTKKVTHAEFAVRAGFNLSYATTDGSSYSGSFSGGILTSASASGRISAELDKPMGFDGAFNYYFAKGLGIQVRIDVNSKAKFSDGGMSDYQLNWTWQSGESYSADASWPVNGDLSLTVISGNVIYKIQGNSMLVPLVSGGVSFFSGKVNADTLVGYAETWEIAPYQFIDYFEIPARLDESISGIGFNVGGGLDLAFSQSIAVNVDARFFARGSIEAPWKLQPGTYTSNVQEGWTLTLSQADVELLQQAISSFKLNLSFFKISLGLKFMF